MSGIERVGVIGGGLMGSGIIEVAARAGLDVVGVEISAEAADRGRGTRRGLAAPGRVPRQDRVRRSHGHPGPHPVRDRARRPGRSRPRGGGRQRGRAGQARPVSSRRADPHEGRRDPGVQHLLHPDREARCRLGPREPRDGRALLQPGPRHAAGRADSVADHLDRDLGPHALLGRGDARQEADRRHRPRRIRRQLACWFRTCSARSACTRPATRRQPTSTAAWCWAVATRWARWP